MESTGEQEDTIQAFSGEMKITNHYHKNNSLGKRFKLESLNMDKECQHRGI